MASTHFSGGVNIAMKIPKADYDRTVAFYRDVLGFSITEAEPGSPGISRSCHLRFGPNTLWLDCVDRYSRCDLWLEIRTDDLEAATSELAAAEIAPVDEVEPITDPDVRGHWIRNPAGVIHLLVEQGSE